MGWTLHMIMCVLLCYPVSFHMLQLLLTGRPISSFKNIVAYFAAYFLTIFPAIVVTWLRHWTTMC